MRMTIVADMYRSHPAASLVGLAMLLLALAALMPLILASLSKVGEGENTGEDKREARRPAATRKDRGLIVVLDLDETLVHSLPPDHQVVVERPHVREFLRRAAEAFVEVAVFTAGTREYAEPILDRLDPERAVFGRRFYRDACSLVVADGDAAEGIVAKDLRLLGLSPEETERRVRLVDNTPSAYALQPMCGVPIKSFMGEDADDRALLDVLDRLLAEQRALIGKDAPLMRRSSKNGREGAENGGPSVWENYGL